MSSGQNPSTITPARTRPGASHRHSKSSSSIAQVPKRHNNRNLTPQHGQSQRSANPSNTNNFSRQFPSKSKGSGDEYTLTHVRSDPTPMANPPLTPPKPSGTAKFTQPYASDGGNLSSNEKKGKKKRPQKRPKDLNTAAAANAVPYGFQGASDAEPALPPMPHTAKPFATPGKHYAGPTFHHSPAPSALPLPSFFSKSVPSSPNGGSGPSLSTMISSEDSEDSDSSPPSEVKVDESPLAKLFRADSEERAAGLRHHRRSRRESLLDDNPFKSRSTGNLPSTHGMTLYGDVEKKPEAKETSGVEMLFPMDALDKKSQVPSDAKNQKNTATGASSEGDLEAAKKRREKASALKEILLQHAPASPEPLWHGVPLPLSPSPKARPGMQRQENVRSRTPTKYENYSTSSTPPPASKSSNDYSPRPMNRFHQKRDLMAQLQDAAIPKKSSTRNDIQDRGAQKDPKVIEDYLRWALKIDTPSATGVRG